MDIAVIGIGALGSLLGAYLSDVADVVLLGHWPEHVQAVREHGLELQTPSGETRRYALRIETDATRIAPLAIAVVATKSRQTLPAARAAAELLREDGLAVTLQNGLSNLSVLQEQLGPTRATLGITSEGATLLGPGVVRHAGFGQTSIGLQPSLGAAQKTSASRLVDCLRAAGLRAELVTDTDGLVWGKLVVNAAINPLSALLRVRNGELLTDERAAALMAQAALEAAAVAAAVGVALPYPDPVEQARAVARATAANQSSMLQDVLRGVPTEIDVITGAVVRRGRAAGIPTPLNTRILELMHEVERTGRPVVAPGDAAALADRVHRESSVHADYSIN